jgi:hypothetical protein
MPEWLVALVILVAVCAIGVYYVNGFHGLVPEGFFDRRSDQQKCDSDYQACLKSGTNASCTATYNTCNANALAANSTVSTVANAPSSNQSGSSAVAALHDVSGDMLGDLATGNHVYKDLYSKLASNALASQPSMGVTSSSASPPAPLSLEPKLQDFLKESRNTGPNTPTGAQLSMAQGGVGSMAQGQVGSMAQGQMGSMAQGQVGRRENDYASSYSPHQEIIRPNGFPRTVQPQLTAIAASDAGTQAEQIRASSPLSPSIREMIRDDIKKTIKEELDSVNHPYSINYEQK